MIRRENDNNCLFQRKISLGLEQFYTGLFFIVKTLVGTKQNIDLCKFT